MVEPSYTPFTNFNFEVTLTLPDGMAAALDLPNQLCKGQFSECDGLEMTMEPKTVREGGNNTQQIHLAGPVNYGTLILKRGMTSDQHLWIWFNAAAASSAVSRRWRGALASAVITMQDAVGNPTVIYNLFDCLPIKLKGSPLNAKDGVVAIEEIQIAYSYFTIEPGPR